MNLVPYFRDVPYAQSAIGNKKYTRKIVNVPCVTYVPYKKIDMYIDVSPIVIVSVCSDRDHAICIACSHFEGNIGNNRERLV